MEIILKCSSFHPVLKKTQSHLDGAFSALIFCDFFYPFFPPAEKKIPSFSPTLANITGNAARESYLMFSLVALVFCWSYGGSAGGLRSGLAGSPPTSL